MTSAFDPLFHYILLQIPRKGDSDMMPPFVPREFTQDPLNRHYDDRVTWLAWREPDTARIPARQRLGRLLIRLGRAIAERGEPSAPALDTTAA
jgi:hypothetical protein